MNLFYVCFHVYIFGITITPCRCGAGPLTIIAYPDLPSDYLDSKFEFDENGFVDPFAKKTKSSMLADCENLRDAILYKASPDAEHKDYPVKIAQKLSFRDTKYEVKEVKIHDSVGGQKLSAEEDGDKYRVYLFRCASSTPDKYYYLSYGFQDELAFMYLFQDTRTETAGTEVREIEFVGRIERKPVCHDGFRGVKTAKKIFLHVINNLEGGVPDALPVEEDALCTLNANQQLRLCSLIDDVRKLTGERVNIITENRHRCIPRVLINLKSGRLSQYRIERFHVNIIPCFDEHSPKFYLTVNPADETAVFTLLPVYKDAEANSVFGSPEKKYEYLVPDGLYQNVSVLKYRTEVY